MKSPPERSASGEPGDEAAVVRAAQRGDQAAFAEIVRRHQRSVYRLAYGLTRNASDADDLAQETFVRAYRALGGFRVGQPLRPWLSRIVVNQAFSLFRHRKRRPETPLEPLVEAGRQFGAEDDPARRVEADERMQHLAAAFAALKPEHQAVLTLRVVEEMSYEDIAGTLAVPIGTVMSRLSRARAELKSLLAERTGEKP
jgi:RNA polymerase sigma-70 factor (ECF subfamily)